MATIIIDISTTGDPTPSAPTVSYGDDVYWQAIQDPITHKYPRWHICFSPFKGHVLKTDPNNGLTQKMTVGRGIGSCSYKILSNDPTLSSKRKSKIKGRAKVFSSGGGIIIDN